MSRTLREFCVLAVFCGAALRLAPEGGVRRVMKVLVTAVLLISLLGSVKGLDGAALLRETARVHESELRLRQRADDARRRLDRLVIEEELTEYILNKAGEKGVRILDTKLSLRWDSSGFWLPESAEIRGSGPTDAILGLLGELRAELGLQEDRLNWVDDDEGQGDTP